MTQREATIAGILRRLAGEYQGPVEERQLLERVLEQRPSSAKNPFATIRERLRWDGLTLGWLRLSRGQLVPLRIALEGLRFRCIPRPRDLVTGLLPLAHLQPFWGACGATCHLRELNGTPLDILPLADDGVRSTGLPAVNCHAWYARVGFCAGDSVIVTVTSVEPLTLTIEHEPQCLFTPAAVAAQDAELLEAIVDRVRRAHAALIPCDEVILPIFAAAPWRTTYPGTPWQQLVVGDGRLRLVDNLFLTSRQLGPLQIIDSDEIFASHPSLHPTDDDRDHALLAEIEALQKELSRSRQLDAEAGIWSGQIRRASTLLGQFDELPLLLYPRAKNLDDQRDELILDLEEEWSGGDEGIELMVDQETLRQAQERMRQLLPPEVVARLQVARPEEAEVIIAQHLNMLLVRAPELFPRIDRLMVSSDEDLSKRASVEELPDLWMDDDDDDDDELIDLDDLSDPDDSSALLARSHDLLRQFHDYLLETGKRMATARMRSQAMLVYAEFLASYYGQTLAEGDYATLDEYLFFHYPYRVLKSSARQVRTICTALKQFYAFLVQRGVIGDARFAEAIWRRRHQAAHVVEIYDRIAGDSPSFDLLFAQLFQPYTG